MTRRPDPNRRDAGVTLVEVLVVLVLISVAAGVVGLSIGRADRGDVAGREADLLVARLNRAADEVVLTGQAIGFAWQAEQYHFTAWKSGAWVPHPVKILRDAHMLPRSLRFGGSGAVVLTPEAALAPPGVLDLTFHQDVQQVATVRFDGLNARRGALR